MKKIYLKPEVEAVVILHKQSLLAGSPDIKDGDVSDFSDLLAPGMETDVNWDILPLNNDVTGF